MAGRAASAAMPRMGYVCYLCPGRPAVVVGGEPGDEEAVEQARQKWQAHLLDTHQKEVGRTSRVVVAGKVQPVTRSGPTVSLPAAA
ncbi:hypothetical protein E1091_07465 [Micromonospora fluostatini]|uniref:Uncharacterized protein n=1 Tax=Micromonospora fluostatini TaxID=1629071 RepID=A0ABY2DIA1_9ACTN|nr:hypothetical protein E1091_07465 [Micromonospora fluostatini]